MSHTLQTSTAAPPDLWDPVVRISHWGLAVVVLLNGIVTGGGSVTHVWLGWTGMTLLVLRLVWGVLGPKEARFSAFPPNPRAALSHLASLVSGRVNHYPSHNPAGAMMIYAFWLSLLLVIGTGLIMTKGATPMRIAAEQAAVNTGDWTALVAKSEGEGGDEGSGWTKEIHAVAANLILILAFLHVAGVVVESRAMRRNLLTPMIIGDRSRRPQK